MSYIKPQHDIKEDYLSDGCISLMSYIKPQHYKTGMTGKEVVYRLCPTSNHNREPGRPHGAMVVYRLCPTSNHNIVGRCTL